MLFISYDMPRHRTGLAVMTVALSPLSTNMAASCDAGMIKLPKEAPTCSSRRPLVVHTLRSMNGDMESGFASRLIRQYTDGGAGDVSVYNERNEYLSRVDGEIPSIGQP